MYFSDTKVKQDLIDVLTLTLAEGGEGVICPGNNGCWAKLWFGGNRYGA